MVFIEKIKKMYRKMVYPNSYSSEALVSFIRNRGGGL